MQRIIDFYINLIKENLYWVKQAGFLFLIALALGVLAYFSTPEYVDDIMQVFRDKFGGQPVYDFNLAVQIFLNNINAAAVALAGGILVGIVPIVVLLSNGLVIGYLLTYFATVPEGATFAGSSLAILSLIPHGIFEIPAILLAAGLGLKIGFNFLKKEHKGNRLDIFWQDVKTGLYSIPLLIVLFALAALAEVFISAQLL